MKQRDIERVMAAAWAVVDVTRWFPATHPVAKLDRALREVDPHGVYRRGTLAQEVAAAQTCEEPEPTLRNSPRMLRTADEAGGHD